MDLVKITITGKSYPVKYGYGAIKLMARAWGVKSFEAVGEEINRLATALGTLDKKNKGLELGLLDKLAELVLAGVYNFDKTLIGTLEVDDVVEALLEDITVLPGIFQELTQSLPKGEDKPVGK